MIKLYEVLDRNFPQFETWSFEYGDWDHFALDRKLRNTLITIRVDEPKDIDPYLLVTYSYLQEFSVLADVNCVDNNSIRVKFFNERIQELAPHIDPRVTELLLAHSPAYLVKRERISSLKDAYATLSRRANRSF